MANRRMTPLAVAIDGPAGSGKSSVSKRVAVLLDFGVLDTGAAYRALTLLGMQRGINPADSRALQQLLDDFDYATDTTPGQFRASVNGVDVTAAIREPEVSRSVSQFSTQPAVREHLNAMFAELIANDPHPGIIIEGRDITTVVAPFAPVRLILTASPEVRARRRAGELGDAEIERIADEIRARDAKDSTVVDFEHPVEGVQLIDTSSLTFDGSVQAVITAIEEVRCAR